MEFEKNIDIIYHINKLKENQIYIIQLNYTIF